MKKLICSIFVVAFMAMVSFAASASDVFHEESGNATSACHTALPQFDNPIRFRPLAVANEGDVNAFVTCSFRAPTNSYGQEWFGLTLKNMSHIDGFAEVTCTAVAGVDNDSAQYMVKTVVLAPGGRNSVSWTRAADNGGDRWQTNTSVSCNLPPNIAINEVSQGYRQK